MNDFSLVRDRMVAAGMIDGGSGRLTAEGFAYTDRIIAELKAAPPPPDGLRPHPGARLPGVRWNTQKGARK
ncbi:MAG: hypothetical protein ACT6Q5_13415 [Sphingopyxis solisilvae]|uniref:hypothetical protein n=1 Tax=Sphingopyxis solisilvae TaxID=1886788 RepID=UPI0040354061